MKSNEAFKKLQEYFDEEVVEVGSREYKKYYAYFVAPEGSDPNEKLFVGNMILVDKESGKVVEMDDLSDDEYDALMEERWTYIGYEDLEDDD